MLNNLPAGSPPNSDKDTFKKLATDKDEDVRYEVAKQTR